MFPYSSQFAMISFRQYMPIPNQNRVKNPWKGELALSELFRSNVVNCLVKTKFLNLPLLFFAEAGSFSWESSDKDYNWISNEYWGFDGFKESDKSKTYPLYSCS